MKRLVAGLIPFDVPRLSDGAFLTAKSLTAHSGSCPVNWRHWREDNYIFRNPASWLLDKRGILVMHVLEDDDSIEAKFLQMVRNKQLLWSYGLTSEPQETRIRVARYESRPVPPKYEIRPLSGETIRHMAYVTESNFKMDPLFIVGE